MWTIFLICVFFENFISYIIDHLDLKFDIFVFLFGVLQYISN